MCGFCRFKLDEVPFWVQIHGLSLGELNPVNAPLLLSQMGEVLEVDDPLILGSGFNHYLRAGVLVNVMKTLWSGCLL